MNQGQQQLIRDQSAAQMPQVISPMQAAAPHQRVGAQPFANFRQMSFSPFTTASSTTNRANTPAGPAASALGQSSPYMPAFTPSTTPEYGLLNASVSAPATASASSAVNIPASATYPGVPSQPTTANPSGLVTTSIEGCPNISVSATADPTLRVDETFKNTYEKAPCFVFEHNSNRGKVLIHRTKRLPGEIARDYREQCGTANAMGEPNQVEQNKNQLEEEWKGLGEKAGNIDAFLGAGKMPKSKES